MLSVVGKIKERFEGNLRRNEVEGMFCWRFGGILSANAKDWAVLYEGQISVFRNLSVTRIYLKLFSDFLFSPSHLIKVAVIDLYPNSIKDDEAWGHKTK
jgi:hypothetical protein